MIFKDITTLSSISPLGSQACPRNATALKMVSLGRADLNITVMLLTLFAVDPTRSGRLLQKVLLRLGN
jgi:hypothetical protein